MGHIYVFRAPRKVNSVRQAGPLPRPNEEVFPIKNFRGLDIVILWPESGYEKTSTSLKKLIPTDITGLQCYREPANRPN